MVRSPGIERVAITALLVTLLQASSAVAADPAAPAGGRETVEMSFMAGGPRPTTVSLADLREAVPEQRVKVFEPYEQAEIEFEALSLPAVLDEVYGKRWRSEEELLFTCTDGYQPTVPVSRVLAHRAYLAYARSRQPEFTIEKVESGRKQTIDVAPFYLIWENLRDEKIRQEGDYGWPYQVVGVELIDSAERFPALIPPEGASDEALAGFNAFRIHCSKCHKLNGQGGSIGPELNAALNPVEVRSPDWLRTWIDDPAKISPGTRMERLNPQLPDRAQVIDQIIAYLEAMANARPKAQ